jgi:hypothetical protein
MKKLLLGVKTRLINFLYNEDRSIASLGGAPPEETISSEIGRHAATNPVAEEAADVLDDIKKDHVENAVIHANKLDAAVRPVITVTDAKTGGPGVHVEESNKPER